MAPEVVVRRLDDGDGFAGRQTLVTGAATGVGRAIAERLAELGARLVVTDVSPVVAELESAHPDNVRAFVADLAESDECDKLVEDALEHLGGRLSLVSHNAGLIGASAAVGEYPEAEFDRIERVNVGGTFRVLRRLLPAMVETGGGSFVAMASATGLAGAPGRIAYSSSKAAMIQMVRTAALEAAGSGVRVNAVCPAAIATAAVLEMMQSAPEVVTEVLARVPNGRLAELDEVVNAVLFLLGDYCPHITGTSLVLDGGRLAGG